MRPTLGLLQHPLRALSGIDDTGTTFTFVAFSQSSETKRVDYATNVKVVPRTSKREARRSFGGTSHVEAESAKKLRRLHALTEADKMLHTD